MAVRKNINRARTAPSGYDYKEVLKKGKAFYKNRDFEMQPRDFGSGVMWTAETVTTPPFKAPNGTILIKRLEKGWEIEA